MSRGNFVKITGTKLVRDVNSMGISNVDQTAKNEYYEKSRAAKIAKEDINKVKHEVLELKSEITELKELIQQLIKNKE